MYPTFGLPMTWALNPEPVLPVRALLGERAAISFSLSL